MKKCKAFVQSSGKCKIKVPYRYNDYCDKDDCPKKPHRSESTSAEKQA